MHIHILEDFRVRTNADPYLVGDFCRGKNDDVRIIIAKRIVNGVWYFVTVPVDSEFVCRAKYLKNEDGRYSSELVEPGMRFNLDE